MTVAEVVLILLRLRDKYGENMVMEQYEAQEGFSVFLFGTRESLDKALGCNCEECQKKREELKKLN